MAFNWGAFLEYAGKGVKDTGEALRQADVDRQAKIRAESEAKRQALMDYYTAQQTKNLDAEMTAKKEKDDREKQAQSVVSDKVLPPIVAGKNPWFSPEEVTPGVADTISTYRGTSGVGSPFSASESAELMSPDQNKPFTAGEKADLFQRNMGPLVDTSVGKTMGTNIENEQKQEADRLERARLQQERLDAQAELARQNALDRASKKSGPDSRLANKAVTELQKVESPLREAVALSSSFDDSYSGFKSNKVGDAVAEYRKRFGKDSDDTNFVDWWQRYQEHKNQIRNKLFGSALTETEKNEFEKATITPGMTAIQVRKNLERQEIAAKIAASKIAKFYQKEGVDRETLNDYASNYNTFDWESYTPPDWYLGKKSQSAPSGSGLAPDKAKRLEELRAKRAAGTLGK